MSFTPQSQKPPIFGRFLFANPFLVIRRSVVSASYGRGKRKGKTGKVYKLPRSLDPRHSHKMQGSVCQQSRHKSHNKINSPDGRLFKDSTG